MEGSFFPLVVEDEEVEEEVTEEVDDRDEGEK